MISKIIDLFLSKLTSESEERVSLLNSFNRVLSEDIYSPIDLPPYTKASATGYALRFKNTLRVKEGAPVVLRIIDSVYEGYTSKFRVCQGEAVKITSGSAIPEGADAILRKECGKEERGRVKVFKRIKENENCSLQGSIIKKGKLVLKKHTVINEEHIMMLSSLGIDNVIVYRKPVIGVFAIGNNLVDIGKQLYDGKSYSDIPCYLYCKIKTNKGFARIYQTTINEEDEIEKTLKEAENQCDIIISLGGKERVKNVFDKLGYNKLTNEVEESEIENTFIYTNKGKGYVALDYKIDSANKIFDLIVKSAIDGMLNIDSLRCN